MSKRHCPTTKLRVLVSVGGAVGHAKFQGMLPAREQEAAPDQAPAQCAPCQENMTILAGAKPVAGRGSALVTGHAGRKVDWVHAHWKPQDSEKYKDISMAELPSNRLNNR